MKVLEIGNTFASSKKVSYLSTDDLLEYDLVIVDLTTLSNQGKSNSIIGYQKRMQNLKEFIQYKDLPIVYTASGIQSFQVDRNGYTQQAYFHEIVPIPAIKTEVKEGTSVLILPNTPMTDFMTRYKEYFSYKCFFNNNPGQTFAETPLIKHPIGIWGKDFVFLPKIEPKISNVEVAFLNDLLIAIKKIRSSKPAVQIPDWASEYIVPGEETLMLEVSDFEKQITQLSIQKANKEKELDEATKVKALFTSTGTDLEEKVETVFVELGFTILAAEENRDDLIIKYNENIAVVEIKGLTKSSAEKNATQLEKWAGNYYDATGIEPKPILIVNSYLEKPLKERNENESPTFPSQMLTYSEKRGHCLISTLQLLGLFYHVKNNPNEKEKMIETIFSTVGRFPLFNDWNEFISYKPLS